MGMIRRADLEQLTRNALVMDLGDLRARGEAIIADAQRRAEEIVEDARRERERLVSSAREEGYKEGHDAGRRDGLEQGAAEGNRSAHDERTGAIDRLSDAWAGALDAFEGERDRMLSEARTEVVRLAGEIARLVTRRVVELDATVVVAQIEAVLGAVVRPTRLTLRVHPDDLHVAKEELPSLVARFDQCTHAELIEDASLSPGSCVATTEGGGRIEADVRAQLERVVAEMLPAEPDLKMTTKPRSDAA